MKMNLRHCRDGKWRGRRAGSSGSARWVGSPDDTPHMPKKK